LESWNETPDENFGEKLLYIDFLVARGLISQKLLQP